MAREIEMRKLCALTLCWNSNSKLQNRLYMFIICISIRHFVCYLRLSMYVCERARAIWLSYSSHFEHSDIIWVFVYFALLLCVCSITCSNRHFLINSHLTFQWNSYKRITKWSSNDFREQRFQEASNDDTKMWSNMIIKRFILRRHQHKWENKTFVALIQILCHQVEMTVATLFGEFIKIFRLSENFLLHFLWYAQKRNVFWFATLEPG